MNRNSRQLRDSLAASPSVYGQEALGVPREEPEGDPGDLGWRVVEVLGKRRTDVTEADVEVMARTIGLIEIRLANPPTRDSDAEQWRRGLMLLGHDPLDSG
ncbi:hypothetical protein HDA40_006944 [Hamadaea flava]|uniref:DUF3140 domain-containing protein n=1 Tax=Hamadaea flava TaxID=1742688 RepID=A0ABV8M2F8_9ACTN|nr:DUF3140 domain-containing protein [Hamadaea flava]MCP2328437.1 hypothetical protein [Hamadaea flava]